MIPYSVLLPVYAKDQSDWFMKSIDSMVKQTWPPHEVVIVEDGPIPDELHQIEKMYTQRYPELFHIISNKKQKGLGLTLQAGVNACSCEWIARMDADDIADPFRCEEELSMAVQNSADIVGCDIDEFIHEADGAIARRVFPAEHEDIVRFSRRKTPFCHPAVMMKKDAVIKAGNYRDIYLLEDYDLFVRILAAGYKGCTVKKVLLHMRVNENFYRRRGGVRYVLTLIRFNYKMLRDGWTSFADFAVRSCGNILVGLAPGSFRMWFYRRFLRK